MSSLESQEFGIKLFKLLSNGENTVFSPFSLSTALSMVLMGIRSTTSYELSKSLFGKTVEENGLEPLAKLLNQTIDNCIKNNSKAMSCANFMYSDSKFEVLSQFKQLIEKYFSANIKELDFENQKQLSLDVINDDIKSATNGKINKLLEDIDDNTVVILANALYFKGLWKSQFAKENTKTDVFTNQRKQKISVEMMFQSKKHPFGYCQQLRAKAVELNYENTNAVMIILLPDEDYSLPQMRDNLSIQSLNQLIKSLHSVTVDLSLPKFKIESTFDLIPSLKSIGINRVFTKSADFSGLSQQKGLYVSQIIQKAIIEVNEEGTEAAAATAVGISLMCLPITEEFVANRPFMYFLLTKKEDQTIDSILFMGECNDPNV